MPRFVIERKFDPLDEGEMEKIGQLSKSIIDTRYPQIRWEHSHVVSDADGNIKTFCVYEAPNEDVIRAHSAEVGFHVIDNIYEIGGDVSPRDFQSV